MKALRRLGAVSLQALMLFGAAAPSAANEPPYRVGYSVWFPPPSTEVPGELPPLTAQDQVRYCAAAEEWSRRIWEVTDGSHLLHRVRFYSGYDMAPAQKPVRWYRWDGEASAPAAGSRTFNAFDAARKCLPVFEYANGQLGGRLTCPNAGETCSAEALEDYRTAAAWWMENRYPLP